MPRFSPEFNFGNLITVLVILGTFLILWGNINARLDQLDRLAVRMEKVADEHIRLQALVEEHHRDDQVLRPGDCACPCEVAPRKAP